mgnify:CR=1 FL=1
MADERVETCLTCESAGGADDAQSLRQSSLRCGAAQQVPEGETRLVGTVVKAAHVVIGGTE